jgi:hypothetical protein
MAGKYSIPITVGVVGHLDAVITGEQELQITSLFSELASHFPNSPVYLLSSLADGADRIVARLFLSLKEANKELAGRFDLVVPLPFSQEEYRKDFSSSSLIEFDSLTEKARRVFPVACEENLTDRPLQYLRAGKFIADSSLILLALWDGEKGKKGGTSDIVRHKIAGDDENVADSTFEYDGTVFIVPTGRQGIKADLKIKGEPLSLSLVLRQ